MLRQIIMHKIIIIRQLISEYEPNVAYTNK